MEQISTSSELHNNTDHLTETITIFKTPETHRIGQKENQQ